MSEQKELFNCAMNNEAKWNLALRMNRIMKCAIWSRSWARSQRARPRHRDRRVVRLNVRKIVERWAKEVFDATRFATRAAGSIRGGVTVSSAV